MSIRKLGGEWDAMLLSIEPRTCKVCGKGLYRNVTLLRGGWSRCTRCDEFVHYSCLARGKVKFLKQRPRLCQVCQNRPKQPVPQSHPAADEGPQSAEETAVPVGSSS